jgi:peptidoglycan/LPS O-acetylase OafA/YrhL
LTEYLESSAPNSALFSAVGKIGDADLSAGPAQFFRDRLWRPFRDAVVGAYRKQYYPLGYSPGLDGLRGLMTLGVMTAHVDFPAFPGMSVCMDIFYVMSGYFITGLLIKDVERYDRVRFFQFYRRRFCRLIPPLAAMMACFLLVCYLFFPDFKARAIDASIGFFYIANWWRAFEQPGIFYMGHTWSLAVEEQFYLVWPLTFLVLYRLFGVGRQLIVLTLTLALAAAAWRFGLTWDGVSFQRLYNGFDTRADALLLGCALAAGLILVPPERWLVIDPVLKRLALPVVFTLFVLILLVFDYRERLYYYIGIPCSAALGAVLVVILVRPLGTILHRVLERRVLTFLGRIFYAMYLWHFPTFMILEHDLRWPVWMTAAVGFPLTIGLAVLSYVLIERHFMRVGGRNRAVADGPVAPLAAPSVLPSRYE